MSRPVGFGNWSNFNNDRGVQRPLNHTVPRTSYSKADYDAAEAIRKEGERKVKSRRLAEERRQGSIKERRGRLEIKQKFCIDCGTIYGRENYPDIDVVAFLRIHRCGKCPPRQNPDQKFCRDCGKVFKRKPGQIRRSWATNTLCDKCRTLGG